MPLTEANYFMKERFLLKKQWLLKRSGCINEIVSLDEVISQVFQIRAHLRSDNTSKNNLAPWNKNNLLR